MESKKKVLLSGATGFIGTNFILQMYKKYDITALVRATSNTAKIESFCNIYIYNMQENVVYQHNNIESKSLSDFMIKGDFDFILHLSGIVPTATKPCNDVRALIESNITFGTYLLEAAKVAKIPYFINAASFGSYCDSLAYRPATLYAASKMAFEDIMYYYALSSPHTTFTSLLIFNVYGPNDTSTRLFNLLDKIALSGESLEMSDGEQVVDYSHVFDVVRGFDYLMELVQKDSKFCKNKIFALRGEQRLKLKELVLLYEKIMGKKLHIKWGARARRELEITLPWEGGELLPNFTFSISLESGFKMIKDSIESSNTNGGGGVSTLTFYHYITLQNLDSIKVLNFITYIDSKVQIYNLDSIADSMIDSMAV
ncbi:NAD-dependent epimerase/dehydratase family protein [Helicobacter saguini]|uniref:NAD-dependent epimerase/dehydratase family protein n=1 Tax=Helicobacter saguini TaxID=1548018 RepID=A0A4U8T1E3_9HELI|nr:NAD-dependent epimerase/dehydratase family protein [Helicobacter saguini]MWV68076.1 NAD-dependent epimerase/dehydratase family protein [Helicobacter saguini]MWV70460.1 NAD-dependent epimerase/dehydratase family protein [Helicobacter saguini]TLD93008.1 SDR family oxidoreductase [Helicobacter saguini]